MKWKEFVGSVTVFTLIILGLIIGMYLVGYRAPAVDYIEKTVYGTEGGLNGSFDIVRFLNGIKDAILSPFGLAVTGVMAFFVVVTTFFSSGTGTVVSTLVEFLVPILLLFAVANVFFFPVVPYAEAEGLPAPIGFLLTIVFNVFLMLAVVSFVSGRE